MTTTSSVVAIYDTHEQAVHAVRELQEAGIDMKSLSIAARNTHTDEHIACHLSQTAAQQDDHHLHMAVSILCGEALALGLASGPACIASCGPVLIPSLLSERAGLKPHARYLSVFLGARLAVYLLFAVVAWKIGALISPPPGARVLLMGAVDLLLAGVLLWYAWSARSICGPSCASVKLVQIGEKKNRRSAGPAVLGLLTGLSLCPPFVAAGVRAAELGSATLAVLFFFCFFVGTTVWFLPFITMGCIARNEAVLTVARMAMALIAFYYLLLGITLLIGKNTYGH